ncbi:MAG: sodium:solute symporter family protein [Candidatus Omnitrophica bacterium]|nr:sodium:solute symporter family protein [Candidatus Omnitrophota bacterium]
MSCIDYVIFVFYMLGVLGIGYYHFRKNRDTDDYYVGSRKMGATAIGFSLVATDVGGGFSIGLGGLGFAMGLAGSWLLFTGLVGAWLSAVFIIPRIKAVDREHGLYTYPDFLRLRYGERVAALAAVISGLGYMGFTGAQILAGAKLASATVITRAPAGLTPLELSLYIIAFITIGYTVIGGLKAVIYTDVIQWMLLLSGLVFVAIPIALAKVGGWAGLQEALPPSYFDITSIRPVTFVNWMVSVVPIWLIGMTLYQRMYACRDEKSARRAWYMAGLLEYPVMAFAGVILGMCARVFFPEVESEMGLPLMLKHYLPIGVTGIVIAAYFSAIMSTADSCLMASSGNMVNDILQRTVLRNMRESSIIRISQVVTLGIGVTAVLIAVQFEKVLEAILYAYGFMVSGLFVPTLGAYFWKRSGRSGAFWGMLAGGSVFLLLKLDIMAMPGFVKTSGLHPSLFGMLASALVFVALSIIKPDRKGDGDVR